MVDTEVEAQEGVLDETITPIDLSDLFRDPEGDPLTLTVTLEDGRALEAIGLEYTSRTDPVTGVVTRAIIGRPNTSGEHTIKVVAEDSRFVDGDEVKEASAPFTFIINIPPPPSVTEGQEIPPIDLSSLFENTDISVLSVAVNRIITETVDGVTTITKTALNLSDIGLTHNMISNEIIGIPTDIGTYEFTITAFYVDATARVVTRRIEVVEQIIEGENIASVTEDGDDGDVNTGVLTIKTTVSNPPAIVLVDANGDDSGGSVTGSYGTMTFDGMTWIYTLDNTKPETQALSVLDEDEPPITEIFIFTAETATGNVIFAVTVTITGVNDPPVADTTIADQEWLIGKAIEAIDLNNFFTDAEGDTVTLTVMVRLSDGTKVGLDTIGLSYNETTKLITGNPNTSGTYTIVIEANDGHGNITTSEFNIEVVKLPVITPINAENEVLESATSAVTEDDETPVTGILSITEGLSEPPTIVLEDGSDTNDDGTFNLEGKYGTLAFVVSTGVWTYTLDVRAQMLKGGTSGIETFTFTAENATPITVTITVVGVNDAPEVNDEILTAINGQTGTIGQEITAIDLRSLFSDADGDTLTLTVMFLDSDGNPVNTGLSYDEVTKLITGAPTDAGTYMINVVATDSNGASFTSSFNIVVVEQIIAGIGTGEVTEDSINNTASGALGHITGAGPAITLKDGTDADLDGAFIREGKYGTMSFVAEGVGIGSASGWTYTLDNTRAVTQGLKEGEEAIETFIFTAGDASFAVTIIVVGVNDAPEAAVKEDGITLVSSDPQSGTVGQPVSIDLSTLFTDPDNDPLVLIVTLDDDSALSTIGLSYDDASKLITGTLLETLAAGSYTIKVVATDSNGASFTSSFILEVVEQTIASSGDVTGSVIEDDALKNSASGTIEFLTISSLDEIELEGSTEDSNNAGTFSREGTYGRMDFVTSTGVWTYTLDDRADALKANTSVEEVFTFVDSGTGSIFTITITATGVNDDPVLTPDIDILIQNEIVNQRIDAIDLSGFFIDPDGDELTLTVTLENGDALSTIGLFYDEFASEITGRTNKLGSHTIKVVASDGFEGSEEAVVTFKLEVTLPTEIVGYTGQPIVELDLSSLFTGPDGEKLTVEVMFLDSNGLSVETGLTYSEITDSTGNVIGGKITGTPTEIGTYMIKVVSTGPVSGQVYERTFELVLNAVRPPTLTFMEVQDVAVADLAVIEDSGPPTEEKIIYFNDPDPKIDNPEVSSRNQLEISIGAQGGTAADVAAARTEFQSEFGNSDVRILASIDLSDTEEKYEVEGKYGRFIITRTRGDDDPNGRPGEISYYYEHYQDGDANYENINTLKKDERAYDVLTIWAVDLLTEAESQQLIANASSEVPQSALDRRVFKTVVVEISGANDAPEVVSKTLDVLYVVNQDISIAIEADNFFDLDGDQLTITARLVNDSVPANDSNLSEIGDFGYDKNTRTITGVIDASGKHTIRVIAEDGNGGEASYTFILSNNVEDITNTQPVVTLGDGEGGGIEQILELTAGVAVASDTDTGFDITYSDADDANSATDDDGEVDYDFYQLGLDNGGNTIRIRPANTLFFVDPDGSIILKQGVLLPLTRPLKLRPLMVKALNRLHKHSQLLSLSPTSVHTLAWATMRHKTFLKT